MGEKTTTILTIKKDKNSVLLVYANSFHHFTINLFYGIYELIDQNKYPHAALFKEFTNMEELRRWTHVWLKRKKKGIVRISFEECLFIVSIIELNAINYKTEMGKEYYNKHKDKLKDVSFEEYRNIILGIAEQIKKPLAEGIEDYPGYHSFRNHLEKLFPRPS